MLRKDDRRPEPMSDRKRTGQKSRDRKQVQEQSFRDHGEGRAVRRKVEKGPREEKPERTVITAAEPKAARRKARGRGEKNPPRVSGNGSRGKGGPPQGKAETGKNTGEEEEGIFEETRGVGGLPRPACFKERNTMFRGRETQGGTGGAIQERGSHENR